MMSSTRKVFVAGAALSSVVLLPELAGAKEADGARLLVFYKTPADESAFEKYYFGTHAPLASKLPGLRSYMVSKSPVFTPDGKPSATYSFFAELGFDSVDAIKSALGSPQGAIVVGDLKNFAQAGVDITMCDVKSA